jgi:hypothetical protein
LFYSEEVIKRGMRIINSGKKIYKIKNTMATGTIDKTQNNTQEVRRTAVRNYFEKIDNGIFDSSYFNLFTEDVELYFPKFGYAKGKEGIKNFGKQIGNHLSSIYHDIENFNYIVADNYIVVEGKEGGVTREGIEWPDNDISYGKFCNVFKFNGHLIERVHIYVDPDFTSSDRERINILKPGIGKQSTEA